MIVWDIIKIFYFIAPTLTKMTYFKQSAISFLIIK